MERNHLEELLHVNGFTSDASEEDIRNVLLSASYSKEEIDKALLTLAEIKQAPAAQTAQTAGNRKLFRSGERLLPAEISQLLGVNVVVNEVVVSARGTKGKLSMFQFMVLWLTSVVLAAVVIMAYMYTQKIGMFHPEMGSMSSKNDV